MLDIGTGGGDRLRDLAGAFGSGLGVDIDDAEYVVRDIESLVFWLNALDLDHADVDGRSGVASAATLNLILAGNVDERGFVTNEHRYLVVLQNPRP